MSKRDEWRQHSIREVVEHNAGTRPDKLFLRTQDDQTTTFGEMAARATAVANSLVDLGVSKGDSVATLMSNSQDVAAIWLGCSLLGAVYVPINTHYKGEFLRHPLALTSASVLVVDDNLAPGACAVLPSLPGVKHVVLSQPSHVPRTEYEVPRGCAEHSMDSMLDGDDKTLHSPDVPSWRDPATISFTSGTTGASKGNVTSNNYLMNLAGAVCDMRNIREHDVLYSPLPMFHNQALLAALLAGQVAGSSVGLDWTFSASGYWDRVRFYGATNLGILGSMFTMLWNRPRLESDSGHRARVMMCAPIPAEIHRPFEERFNLRLVTAYGTTESSLPVTSKWDEPVPPGFSGRESPWAEVRLVDEQDEEVATGEVGELVARPRESHVFCDGYVRNAEATVENWRNLWVHTGDLLRKDEDGWFQFVDRKADYLRRRGENVSSFEVERAILTHPKVAEVAVHGQKSEFSEDDVKAWIVVSEGEELCAEDLLDYCQTQMPYFAVPRYVAFIDELPINPLGKVMKYELRERDNSTAWDREAAGYEVKRQDR